MWLALNNWPVDCVVIEVTNDGKLRIGAGHLNTAPMYLIETSDRLEVSWDINSLKSAASRLPINKVPARDFCLNRPAYSSATPLCGMFQMTERSVATYDGTSLKISYPEPAPHSMPRELRPTADPVSSFEALLYESFVQRDFTRSRAVFSELSGGLDSAQVTLMASRASVLTGTYGISLPGAAGRQQSRKRAAINRRTGVPDATVNALDYLPLSNRRAGRGAYLPFHEEPYAEALAQILDTVGAKDSVVLTGIGGDELLAQRAFEMERTPSAHQTNHSLESLIFTDLPPICEAPASVISESSLSAAASRSPIFMRAGAWPVNILGTAELTRFCEWLPLAWRRKRLLFQVSLEKSCGDVFSIANNPVKENFTPVMRAGVDQYLNGASRRLGADTYHDGKMLSRSVFDVIISRYRSRGIGAEQLYEALAIEAWLNSIRG